jgi:argininosuccinate lyase
LAEQALEIGARLQHGPSERLVQAAFRRELDAQAELLDAMDWVDLAHTLVLVENGIVPCDAGQELLAVLLRLQQRPEDFIPDPARGDLYTNREAWLAGQSPSVAWLGTGRARREATTTAFLMTLRTGLLGLAEALAASGKLLVAKARETGSAPMPDYTYLQAAQPTTFGHYLLGFVYPLLRDLERLRALYRRVNRSPAGCGSSNGSRLPQGRERLAALLGFDGLAVHARDAMWQADLPVETAALLTTVLVNLDRLAEDLQVFSSAEFALVELDDRHARASKIMPQKKNPFALTHVRGLANTMLGTLVSSAALGRTPSGQPDNRLPLYGMLPRAVEDTRQAAALLGEVVEFLVFDAAHARRKLDGSFAFATELAEVLVLQCGLDFRAAHRLLGYLVRRHLPDGDLRRLGVEELAETAEQLLGRRIELAPPALANALDAEAAIAARTEQGCAAPGAMAAMLDECAAVLADGETWIEDCRQRLHLAEDALRQAVL